MPKLPLNYKPQMWFITEISQSNLRNLQWHIYIGEGKTTAFWVRRTVAVSTAAIGQDGSRPRQSKLSYYRLLAIVHQNGSTTAKVIVTGLPQFTKTIAQPWKLLLLACRGSPKQHTNCDSERQGLLMRFNTLMKMQ